MALKIQFALVILLVCLLLSCDARGRRRGDRGSKLLHTEDAPRSNKTESRDKRLLSLFSIVTFKNTECTTQSESTTSGTCLAASQCTGNSGVADGSCASGFGVCCVYRLTACGGSVDKNCTYIQNADYPSGFTSTQTCQFTLNRIDSDLCRVRLDFDNLVLNQPTTGTCADTAVLASPTGANPPSNLCGTLSGEHIYVETGPDEADSAGTFTITTATSTTFSRTYKIKVSFIECSNPVLPPANCVQYYTGVGGAIKSLNFDEGAQFKNLNYQLCIRQEEDYCTVAFQESAIATPEAFALDPTGGGAKLAVTCTNNFLEISGSTYCGDALSTIADNTTPGIVTSLSGVQPFRVGYFSSSTNTGGTGFNLLYSQLPC